VAGIVEDFEAEKRSLMAKAKPLCNGEKNGRSCVHYWAHVEKVESVNPDYLRRGELFRVCGFHPSIAHEMNQHQLAVECNRYAPRRLPLFKRPLAVLGLVKDPGKYDPNFEEYQPISAAQLKLLQEETPSTSEAIAEMKKLVAKAKEPQQPEVTLAEALGEDTETGEGIFAKED
jgi:hypothetical protein